MKNLRLLLAFLMAICSTASVKAQEAYAAYMESYEDSTLTFYYDNLKSTRSGTKFSLNTGENSPAWSNIKDDVTVVRFDPSFANARPTTCYAWFSHMSKLKYFWDIEYLNTSEVTNMQAMFANCYSLYASGLSVSGFDTHNVTTMRAMFQGCSQLSQIIMSNWDTGKVTDMSYMFYGCVELHSPTGLGDLDVSNVTTMEHMFDRCASLRVLTLGNWDTGKVKNMNSMFEYCTFMVSVNTRYWNTSSATTMMNMFKNCKVLTGLNVSSFNTSNVVNMSGMFYACDSLKNLNVTNFNTGKVTSMSEMFYQCRSLTNLDVTHFDTREVLLMDGMFQACYSLTSLDLKSFDTHKVTHMEDMFRGSNKLAKIKVGEGWNTDNVTSSESMFRGCTALTGEAGTTYDANHLDATYAHIDGGTAAPGYLTSAYEAYALWSGYNSTLYFYYDDLRETYVAPTYDMNVDNYSPGWAVKHADVIKVEFDPSFVKARPKSTYMWFNTMTNLTTITGLEYLNTSEVTNMGYMFRQCGLLTNINLNYPLFDTRNVTSMWLMFNECTNVESIDIGNFDTSNVTDMNGMFAGCSSLSSLNLSSFNTSAVTEMGWMFSLCPALTRLDLSSFNTQNVTDMRRMFNGCSALQSITVGDGWNTGNVTQSESMFSSCDNLVGNQGTVYDANHVDAAYARVDGGPEAPGYLGDGREAYAVYANNTLSFYFDDQRASREGTTYGLNVGNIKPGWYNLLADATTVVFDPSFADARPTSCYAWFYNMPALTSIEGIEYLNTSQVTNMNYMFCTCQGLTVLDLRHFNTQKVTTMNCMFHTCSSLRAIIVGDGWSTGAVTSSESMFATCYKLSGGMGTSLDSSHTDAGYAHLDGGAENPGYLTDMEAYLNQPYALLSSDGTTLTFYDDGQWSSQTNPYLLNVGSNWPGWYDLCAGITSVVFDPSFASARPTSCYAWFRGMTNLTSITGLGYLNTSQVKNMAMMFDSCNGLTVLNISGFNTANVTNMSSMFYNCYRMTTIIVGDGWSTGAVTNSSQMFLACIKLAGGKGTFFDSSHIDAGYAHLDGGSDAPGYFTDMETYLNWPYALLSADGTTLTFYGDGHWTSQTNPYLLNAGSNQPSWYDQRAGITSVVFDSSFANARPTSTYYWFYEMSALTSITGLEYLNTSQVTNMSGMFYGCSGLTSIDLSRFNTSAVTNMNSMFHSCSNLRAIIVGDGWSTGAVTSSESMFASCSKLVGRMGTGYNSSYTDAGYAHLDGGAENPGYLTDMETYLNQPYALLSSDGTTLTFYADGQFTSQTNPYFMNTGSNWPSWYDQRAGITSVVFDPSFADARPTNCYAWFRGMTNLTSITGLEYLNTSQVTNMAMMFDSCNGLTMLDLSGFNTANVTNMSSMFYNCYRMTTIIVGDGWSTGAVTNSSQMFLACSKLAGGKGTIFDSSHIDAGYARLDGGPDAPGYLTDMETYLNWTYALLSADGTTLTFYADGQWTSQTNPYLLSIGTNNPGWYDQRAGITTVVFDSSFANARPMSTYNWFYGMSALTSITGIEYLNTSKVTNMSGMFYGCSGLTSIDLSHFNTSAVTNMQTMFLNCTQLTYLDLSSFNTSAVTNMNSMFYNCTKLETIIVGDGWSTENVTTSEYMFRFCSKLVGQMGTIYNSSYINAGYAHLDGGAENPGYFTSMEAYLNRSYALLSADGTTLTFYADGEWTSQTNPYFMNAGSNYPGWKDQATGITTVVFDPSFASARPTSTYYWFYNMSALTSITGLEYLNTSQVTNMTYMFYNCQQLTALDLHSFDTQRVTEMIGMFNNCNNLATIIVGDGWTTENVTQSSSMFNACRKLVGGKGTAYDLYIADATYARLDGGPEAPGYFTDLQTYLNTPYALLSADGTTLTFYADGRWTSQTNPYLLSAGSNQPGWYDQRAGITSVVFDSSFASARPLSTYMWFCDMSNLSTITGLEYLNTSEVITMNNMFRNCKALTELDVSSFNTANVTNMGWMFYYCDKLTTLDLSNFNTAKVTNMGNMFSFCYQLKDLDVSSFNTEQVTTMYQMFEYCQSMKSLNLTSFNTANVTNMGGMFYNCTQIECIMVGSGWSTERVTSSSNMFTNCSRIVGERGTTFNSSQVGHAYARLDGGTDAPGYFSAAESYAVFSDEGATLTFYYDLRRNKHTEGTTYPLNRGNSSPNWRPSSFNYTLTTVVFDPSFANARPTSTNSWFYYMCKLNRFVGLENLNTSEVTNMGMMFNYCTGLTSINLSNFNTSKVTNMNYMFYNCNKLTTIFVDEWSTESLTSSAYMFTNCSVLIGGNGTPYNSSYVDAIYARIDGGPQSDTPGYFTLYVEPEAYAFIPNDDAATTDVDESTTLYFYYDGLRSDRRTKGTTYDLNTGTNLPSWNNQRTSITNVVFSSTFADARPTTTYLWFSGMRNLTDISGLEYLNTEDVTRMTSMFYDCYNLVSLDVSGFVTDNVTDMSAMFYDCATLTSLDLSHFNTHNVTNMNSMFQYCTSIPSLDLSAFDTGNVTDMYGMFNHCEALTSLNLSGFNTEKVRNMGYMFCQCKKLTTLDLSAFDTKNVTDMSLMFFLCSKLTSLDLSGFNTGKVTTMYNMFYNCAALTSLDVSGFNTEKVTNMSDMFNQCKKLTTLDLSSFNTSAVTNMYRMFISCTDLNTVYVGSGWNTANVSNSENMFYNSTSLVGGKGTNFDANHLDKEYARIDGGPQSDTPGYFTLKPNTLLGDINGDGFITIADVTALVNIILGKTTDYDQRVADVNEDHSVTIADVTALVNIILGK